MSSSSVHLHLQGDDPFLQLFLLPKYGLHLVGTKDVQGDQPGLGVRLDVGDQLGVAVFITRRETGRFEVVKDFITSS